MPLKSYHPHHTQPIPIAATASSSISMASSSSKHTMFDVFLSFRGEDTRHSFTDHLYAALNRAGVSTFRDNDDMKRGQDLEPELVKAIKESKASIVVISENYAKSRWCLDELVLILDQRRKFSRYVLPVFYHVKPSDVRNHRQSFAIEETEWTEVKVNQWKAALNEVANLSGLVVSGSETEYITKIVHTVDSELDLKQVSTPAHLTGMETRAEVINSWLKNERLNCSVLAICGMGGIGKTTLSNYIYNLNKKKFESSSFLEDIGKHYQQPLGLHGLQKQLLRDILGGSYEKPPSECTSKIEKALQIKRVLIVLDDIDEYDQLATLLGTNAFPTQSKIIITTRRLDIHAWFGSISQGCEVYELKLMNEDESLELLCWHAFGSKNPLKGFKKLAVKLARYCRGNPLALEVLGSSLFVKADDEQKRNDMIDVWRSTLTSLNSFKGDIHKNIQFILRQSFDSLPREIHKELFLHICFFFVGEYEDYVVTILEHEWHAKAGIITLINRCLLTVSPSKKVMMHQLLQEMGRRIVFEESKIPAERRVVDDDESYQVLDKGKGSKTIEGLALDIQKCKQGMRSKQLALKSDSITKMDKLKLLQLKHVELSGSYENFPELRWLSWYRSCLKTIPSGLLMSSLVAIDMTNGDLEEFESPVVLHLLKILILKDCENLVSVRNLHQLPNLETLILWNCWNLTHVCESIGCLAHLHQLDLTGCSKLCEALCIKNQLESLEALGIDEGIPLQTFFLPDSLSSLFLYNCNLAYDDEFPVGFNGRPILYMNLGSNQFEYFTSTIDIQTVRVLDFSFCVKLKSLLCLPSTLEELYVYSCPLLEQITFQSARFKLREFGYIGCDNLSDIQGLFSLVSVKNIGEADLDQHMKWIKSCEDDTVELVGDEITKGGFQHIQILYEYGITSTYLSGKYQSMMTSEYMSSSSFLSFHVPSGPSKRKTTGLNVTSFYRSSDEYEDQDKEVLFAKISNRTKGLTWIYNPVVYSKPRVNENAVWLSYWPIGNVLDTGDEVNVDIFVGNGFIVSGCGATLVDSEICQENCKYIIEEKEVIGGDLSDFELTEGAFYLCRRDFFKTMTPYWLQKLVGDTVHYEELKGWKKSRQSHLKASYSELQTFRGPHHKKIVLRIELDGKNECDETKRQLFKAVCSLYGVYSVSWDSTDERIARLTVTSDGDVDPLDVIRKTKKIAHTEILTVGPANVWN